MKKALIGAATAAALLVGGVAAFGATSQQPQPTAPAAPSASASAPAAETAPAADEAGYLEMIANNWNSELDAALDDDTALQLGYEACANRESGDSDPADRMFPSIEQWNENVVESNAWLRLCPN